MNIRKLLLKIWRPLPFWVQEAAAFIIRPRYQVAVGIMLFNERGQLLLCEHTYRRLHPWGLPGGDLNPGEDPMDGIRRELLEETGLKVESIRLLLIENSKEIHHLNLTYLGSGVTGTFVPSDEVSSIAYFDTNNLPVFFPSQKQTIDRGLEQLRSEAKES